MPEGQVVTAALEIILAYWASALLFLPLVTRSVRMICSVVCRFLFIGQRIGLFLILIVQDNVYILFRKSYVLNYQCQEKLSQ